MTRGANVYFGPADVISSYTNIWLRSPRLICRDSATFMNHQHKFASAFCKKFSASTGIDGISQRLANESTAASSSSFLPRSIIDSDLETPTKRETKKFNNLLLSIGTMNHSTEHNSQTVSAQHNLGGIDENEEKEIGACSDVFLVWELYGRIKCVCVPRLCVPLW